MTFQTTRLSGTGSACPEKAEYAFLEAMQAVFGPLDFVPAMDGAIHREHAPGDNSGTRNLWYVGFTDNIASGAFGSWKLGRTETWSSRQPTSTAELHLIRQRMEQAKAQRLAERQQQQQLAADKARLLWSQALPASPDHAYLVAKGVAPHNLRQRGQALLVPLIHDGQLVNLQFIQADGSKRFLTGGRLKGCCSPIGNPDPSQRFLVCEGWGTGATLHQNTGNTILCAMTANNLEAVAVALRSQFPAAEILICGDDDRLTPGNPGRKAARGAAVAASARYCFPVWPVDAPQDLTDFNDLACWQKRQGVNV